MEAQYFYYLDNTIQPVQEVLLNGKWESFTEVTTVEKRPTTELSLIWVGTNLRPIRDIHT